MLRSGRPVVVVDVLAVSVLSNKSFPVRDSSVGVGPLSSSESGVLIARVADEVVVVVVFGGQLDVVNGHSVLVTFS